MELNQFRIEAPISLYPASLPQKTKKKQKKHWNKEKPQYEMG